MTMIGTKRVNDEDVSLEGTGGLDFVVEKGKVRGMRRKRKEL